MKVCCPVDLLFRSAFWLFVLLIFQIFCLFVRLLFLALVFVLFAAFVAHGVPPLVLPVILSVRVTGSLMMNAIRSMSRRQGREWVGRAISYQRNNVRRYMANNQPWYRYSAIFATADPSFLSGCTLQPHIFTVQHGDAVIPV